MTLETLRVIPDVNVLLRAITGRGLPQRLYTHFRRGELRFVISADLITELGRTLTYPRVLGMGRGITPSETFSLAVELLTLAEYHPHVPRLEWPSLHDPKDWFLLDLLWNTKADALLTLDGRLLESGTVLDMRVMTVEQFHSGGSFPPLEDHPGAGG